jgi:hypothetical protein
LATNVATVFRELGFVVDMVGNEALKITWGGPITQADYRHPCQSSGIHIAPLAESPSVVPSPTTEEAPAAAGGTVVVAVVKKEEVLAVVKKEPAA